MAITQEKAYELAQSMIKLFVFFKPKKFINNVKPIEIMVLKTISIVGKENHAGVTPSKICEELGLSKSALTAILNSLEERKFIDRTLSKDDRRMIFVSLTTEANKLMDTCHSDLQNTFLNLAEYLGEEDTLKFIELISKSQEFLMK